MVISRSEIRQDISEKPCEKCGELIEQDKDSVVTFFRGSFIQLHEECGDFIQRGQKGLRGNREDDEGSL